MASLSELDKHIRDIEGLSAPDPEPTTSGLYELLRAELITERFGAPG